MYFREDEEREMPQDFHQASPIVTNHHQSSPIVTNRHQSSPIVTNRHQSSPRVTNRHQSSPSVTNLVTFDTSGPRQAANRFYFYKRTTQARQSVNALSCLSFASQI
ncbi:hypothetical protein EVAR_28878_1 [Eumeta japonica]|uniref:Uncharacterized protein n=1 Tax=Eumeta variegata TaxID=151549 RepID=A0A4C1WXV5_EUMVA|nr:hypothetical protein EVAR_28878_1 [Eumeta japonica]